MVFFNAERKKMMEQISFLEGYTNVDSLIHRLDPRVKILAFFSLVFLVVLTPIEVGISKFIGYFFLLFFLILFAQVPIKYVLQRSLVIFPFVVVITIFLPFASYNNVSNTIQVWGLNVSQQGLLLCESIIVKAWLSVITMIVLTNTTKFTDLLKGLEKLRFAPIMVLIISFMYRYIFVFLEEIKSVQRAMQSRNFGGTKVWQWKMLSAMLANIFLRTYEQSERVYTAMLARGFDGQVRTLKQMKITKIDCCFFLLFFLIIFIIRFGW